MKNFITSKYPEENFSCIRLIARKKESIPALGMDELKTETEARLKILQKMHMQKNLLQMSAKHYIKIIIIFHLATALSKVFSIIIKKNQ